MLLSVGILVSLPPVQTFLGQKAAEFLNSKYKTDITIQGANFSIFGGIKLKEVLIKDYKKDTLFYIKILKTNILDAKKLVDGDLHFGEVRFEKLYFNLKNYKGEKENNLDKFIALFEDKKPSTSTKKFLLTANELHLSNSTFSFIDENLEEPLMYRAKKLHAFTTNFKILGPDVSTKIKEMSFTDNRNLVINNITTNFSYSKKAIILDKLELRTPQSSLNGNVALHYKREDFANFNNKVIFDVKIKKATVSSNDLKLFYNEFGSNQTFNLKGNILGTLNNFVFKKIRLFDAKKSIINGDFTFKNVFSKNKNDFYMYGNFSKLSSNYTNLVAILPKVLGKNLPTSFKKLGFFTISGTTEVTLKTLNAKVVLLSDLGKAKANVKMTNIDNINKIQYIGNIQLEQFNLGNFLNEPKLSKVSLNLNVNGTAFTEKYLNANVKGEVSSIYFNKYTYKNLQIDGEFKKPIFKGNLNINDPNLQMIFNGIVDLSKKDAKYDFHAEIDYANLEKLKIYTQDSIAVFRGNITTNLHGNTIDNLYGSVNVSQTSFENSKDIYLFEDFAIHSSFDASKERTLTINSPDIVEGKVVGKFQYKQLIKLIENSLGSLYANYSPNKVTKGQYLKFDFKVYSKFVELFLPEISLEKNTFIKGAINSNDNEFRFNFKSPNIVAYKNSFDNVIIDIDNKNPLYNAYIQVDSIKTKQYKIADFSLINVTANDTLFFRSEFKGGKKVQDYYNLNMYHTINKENNSVVGIKKSEIKFKDYLWFLNENDTKDNKVIFNKKLTDFSIEKISMTHQKQNIELMGIMRDSTYKDLKLSFKDVELEKITPEIDSLKVQGRLNGLVNFKQNKAIYEPSSSITIDSLAINNLPLGTLNLQAVGDNTFKKFSINSSLNNNNNTKTFSTTGNVFVEDKNTLLDLKVQLNSFNLGIFSPLGAGVISDIRGLASGSASISGELENPDITGRIYLNKAGMKVPYLNVDYNLDNNSIVEVTENQFTFRSIGITDSEFNTKGLLRGSIRHHKFSDWELDLNISSKNILALNTQYAEDALYYGTAFIDGNTTIKGGLSDLVINVNAKSAKGTSIKIPISDSETTSEKDFIKFKTEEDKTAAKKAAKATKTYNGVALNFELDITPDAEIEVIIDKNSGHALKGKGVGSLLMEINTLGKFNMWGDFQVYQGTYNFKYGGIIDKKFEVKKGGSISWDGNPLNATLNMEAVYKTEANPAILLANPTFNKKIPTEVVIKLTDKLTNPIPDISIDFPTLSSVLKSELDYKLSDDDTRQTQAMALLSSGSFLSEKGVGENIITGNLLEKASSLFQDIFSNPDDKLKVGLNYVQGDKKNTEQQTDGRVGITLSTQISEKITINGKLGVPIGGVTESTIVGDVEVLLRLNEDGSLKAKVFNRENDTRYIGEGIGYTQGVGISYEVDFNTFKELIGKIINSKKNQQENEKKQNEEIPDSDLTPQFIQFTEQRQKKIIEKPSKPIEKAPEPD